MSRVDSLEKTFGFLSLADSSRALCRNQINQIDIFDTRKLIATSAHLISARLILNLLSGGEGRDLNEGEIS